MDFLKQAFGGLEGLFVDSLNKGLTTKQRSEIAERIKRWLSEEARKKPLKNLPDRISAMNKRFEELADELEISMESGELVVKAAGKASETLRALNNGMDWFDPCESVEGLVISALWERS
jgi:predicted nuclease with TOPRIM domain